MMHKDFFSLAGNINQRNYCFVGGSMQNLSSRMNNPALLQGLFWGIILGIILVAFSFISNALGLLGTLIIFALYLVFAYLAGWRASQKTGKLVTGVLAGLLTGLISALIISLVFALYDLLNFGALLQSVKDTAIKQGQNPNSITSTSVTTTILISVLINLVLAVLIGVAGGALGGNIGSKRAQLPPTEEHQESMLEPPSTTPPAK